MSKVKVSASISIDGFGARPHDKDGGTTGIDDDFFARSFLNVGAWIFGRNMFGPVREPWRDNSWKGGWGDAALPSSQAPSCWAKSTMLPQTTSKSSDFALSGTATGLSPYSFGR